MLIDLISSHLVCHITFTKLKYQFFVNLTILDVFVNKNKLLSINNQSIKYSFSAKLLKVYI
ncbi:hypothetical protein GW891_03540 [bacterium]|nr:hypothetical protein [bacterium]